MAEPVFASAVELAAYIRNPPAGVELKAYKEGTAVFYSSKDPVGTDNGQRAVEFINEQAALGRKCFRSAS